MSSSRHWYPATPIASLPHPTSWLWPCGPGMPYANYVASQGLDTRSDLGGLNLSTVPKVFIECGNMRNATDAALLGSPDFRQRAAQALAQGIEAFLASLPSRA